jgi:hypothetical protein
VIVLGQSPDVLKVDLTAGQRFVCTLQAVQADEVTPQDWPTGVVITLDFGDPGIQWTAVLDPLDLSKARFEATAPAVDAVIASQPAGVRLVIDEYRVATGCVTVLHDGIG